MAYTALVAPDLTSGLIEAGEKLVRALDAASIPVTAAFWLLSDEDVGWRLVIVSPEVAKVGARQFYGRLDDCLRTLGDLELSISHITAARPDDATVSLLRAALKTSEGISRIRFTRNVIKGVLIPDTLIYRLL